MFAIIRTGGKQYRVQPGDHLKVEKLEQALGAQFDIADVLFIGGEAPQFGNPLLKGAKVSVVVTQQDKAKKVLVFKKKRRKGFRRMKGHRQPFTELFVKSIVAPNGKSVNAENEPRIINPEEIAQKKLQYAQAAAKADKKESSEEKKTAAATHRAHAQKAKAAKKTAKKKAAPKKGAKSAKKKTVKKTAKKKE
jgi:large subunit ribosomal protein L21